MTQTLAVANHAYFVTGKPGTYRAICKCGAWESAHKRTSREAVAAGAGHARAARAAQVKAQKAAAREAAALAAAATLVASAVPAREDFTTAT